MAFWYLNKQTNDARIFTGIPALTKKTGIKPDNLIRVFSRLKLQEFENDEYRIVKTAVENSK